MKYNQINTLNFIDLFAGCGGLSLGLEEAGFSPIFVNEIDQDALETYLINREMRFPHLRDPSFYSRDIKSCLKKSYIDELKKNLISKLGISEVDLICGGPPCQGFSGLGIRRSYNIDKKHIPSNYLYEDMANFIKQINPKMFLFENVQGLLSSRWTSSGPKGEVFASVLKTFEAISGYKVAYELLFSRDFGVPQRRPRVFIVGLRDDVVQKIDFDEKDIKFLPTGGLTAPNISDILSDLVDENYTNGGSTSQYPAKALNKTQKYFRTLPDGSLLKKGDLLTEHEYSKHSERVIQRFKRIIENKGKADLNLKTKKFAQRMLPAQWSESGPNITITSMPDDYIHFLQPRAPTLRECARIQTFPDWYQFSGKRTTGGKRRAGVPTDNNFNRELPKFTQIGNAVPVMLARKIGEHFKYLIEKSS